MESTKNEQLKKKYIAVGAALVVAIVGLYLTFGGKEEPTPQGSALSQGATLSKGVEEPKTLDSFVKGTGAQQNNIQAVDSKKFISIDNISITSEQADKMMMNSIMSTDIERVKYLLTSGVKVDLTDDKVCTRDTINYRKTGSSTLDDQDDKKPMADRDYILQPEKVMEEFTSIHPYATYTASCDKLFFNAAYKQLDRSFTDEEFDIFHKEKLEKQWKQSNGGVDFQTFYKESRTQMQRDYKLKREIFDLILAATPKKDYYQFIPAIENSDIPVDIRLNLVKLYAENIDTLPVTEERAKFVKAYEDTALSLLQATPTDATLLKIVSAYKNPLYTVFLRKSELLHALLSDGVYQSSKFEQHVDNEKKLNPKAKIANLIIPKVTVKSFQDKSIPYVIQNMDDETAKNVTPTHYTKNGLDISKTNFLQLFYANEEFRVLKAMLDTGKIDINQQNSEGETYLHKVIGFGLDWNGSSAGGGSDRTSAILVRYFLNNGANPALMDKKGNTPHGLIHEANSNFRKHHPSSTENPHKEKQDAFTLKEYN